jgi:hypothetical protein
MIVLEIFGAMVVAILLCADDLLAILETPDEEVDRDTGDGYSNDPT